MNGLFEITAMPSNGLNKNAFLDVMANDGFALIYDAKEEKTRLYLQNEADMKAGALCEQLPGLELVKSESSIRFSEPRIISLYKSFVNNSEDKNESGFQAIREGRLAIVFLPCEDSETEDFKVKIERMLNAKRVKATKSIFEGALGARVNSSIHTDVYDESEEKRLLLSLLEDTDETLLSGSLLFKIFFVIENCEDKTYRQLSTSSIIMQDMKVVSGDLDSLVESLKSHNSILFGRRHATGFMGFHWISKINYPLETFMGDSGNGAVVLGAYAKGGTYKTEKLVSIVDSALNLGFIMAGLPGSGKTREAMAIMSQVLKQNKKTKVAIISPTEEWDSFAVEHGMNLIRMNKDATPINFFSNPENSNAEKFYEDLAFLISIASKSGPYQNPIEKCLLNAFKSGHEKEDKNPTSLYERIEESIIRFHGKVTNTGTKYTKHGENIKASLENLRQILGKSQYSVTSGILFRELINTGVIFNLSHVSNATKPYLYALILNQLYSIADSFDTEGDNELRLVICIEEAQIIFGGGKESAATEDLVRRIQDFRKRGIGIVLVTHSISDIDPGIRRVCQNKIYFKQAPDVAVLAAKDLVFTYAKQEDVIMKLKHLDSRMGAVDFVRKSGGEKVSGDSVFIRTLEYAPKRISNSIIDEYEKPKLKFNREDKINAVFEFSDMRRRQEKRASSFSIQFLGEKIGYGPIEDGFSADNLLRDRRYTVTLFSENNRILGACAVNASEKIVLILADLGLVVLPANRSSSS